MARLDCRNLPSLKIVSMSKEMDSGAESRGGFNGDSVDSSRHVWLQVVRGEVRVNGHELVEGDGLAITAAQKIDIMGVADEADAIVFDLA
jgi:redox-sensitive bicupin YhaK (pirin superfamily)